MARGQREVEIDPSCRIRGFVNGGRKESGQELADGKGPRTGGTGGVHVNVSGA